MLISHEVPLQLLEISKSFFNDYDYCLLHLTYEIPEYRDFYINAVKEGRQVLLDNSLFELGDALTNEQLAQGVRDIKPTWYVVPDCLNDATTTIARFDSFKRDYPDLEGLSIGVAHGSNKEELIECYKYMAEHADKIAIPFDSKAFDDFSDEEDTLKKWCEGRQRFIQYLYDNNLLSDKPHHLLGCSLAREFSYPLYGLINIETIDTSNPVVAAIEGLKYKTNGLDTKPGIKLCDLINCKLSVEQYVTTVYNIFTFKEICRHEEVDSTL